MLQVLRTPLLPKCHKENETNDKLALLVGSIWASGVIRISSDGPPVQSVFTSQSLHDRIFFKKKIRRSKIQRNFSPLFFAS